MEEMYSSWINFLFSKFQPHLFFFFTIYFYYHIIVVLEYIVTFTKLFEIYLW
jgi:hypothetical protein